MAGYVNDVLMMTSGGYGFGISSDRMQTPPIWLEYPTRQDAEAAHALVVKALESASVVHVKHP